MPSSLDPVPPAEVRFRPMIKPRPLRGRGPGWPIQAALGLTLLSLLLGPVPAEAFGKNKLRTHEFSWNIFATPHFEIFYYPEEEALAREVCRISEEAFERDAQLLRFQPRERTPLFIYSDQIDFQQTNILPTVIGFGVGGFTESYKNRIALPATASLQKLRQVIYHELTHALQNDILYGEGIRSFRVYKSYLLPLWLVEGLAEYAAQDWDTLADMVVRDAVIHDRLLPLTLLDGFDHLEDVYLAYKESQLAVQYLAERYGEDKLATIIKKFKNQIAISQILRETLGVGLSEFNDQFFYWVRQKYWVQTEGRNAPAQYGKSVFATPAARLSTTAGPAWSPDGRVLAFVSDRDQRARIYLRERGAAESRPLTSAKFESFSFQGTPLAWSPDGREIAFFARSEGKSALFRVEVATGRLARDELPLDDYYSPAWSPDGKYLALAGVKAGVGNIYLWNRQTRQLQALTSDRWADESPAWAPDGQSIVFSTERGEFWQLAWKSLDSPPGEESRLLTRGASNHISPAWAPDRRLYYSGDANGVYNLYRLQPETGAEERLTDVSSGCFQPAVSPDGKRLAFSIYDLGSREVLTASLDAFKPVTDDHLRPVVAVPRADTVAAHAAALAARRAAADHHFEESADEAPDAAIFPLTSAAAGNNPAAAGNNPAAAGNNPAAAGNSPVAAGNSRAAAGNSRVATADPILSSYPYRFRFTPDLLFLLAGYDSSQGLIGGGYVTASDFLGDHLVTFSTDLVPGYQANTVLNYGNFMFPVDLYLTFSYSRNFYRLLNLETGTITDEFNDQETLGALALSKPFTYFDRVETQIALRYLRREHGQDILNRRISTLSFAIVHDSTAWYDFEPAGGERYTLSLLLADRFLGGEETYSVLQLNSQAYRSLDFINPFLVLGGRLLAAASIGPDHPVLLFAGIGILPSSGTIRGYSYGDLQGSQVAAANLELRFPLARHVNYTLWPLDFLLIKDIQMVVFDDVGIVSNNLFETTADGLRNSVGVGIRIHSFLLGKELLTFRFDAAKLTNANSDLYYTFGLGQAF